jgi:prepilin-type N-terminal cleavage/methylation domain-containing protein
MKIKTKGFTLIELLVVIAIIGILSSVVLASLNSARNKGADAAIKSNLANQRAEAELFYDIDNNYEGVCATTGTNVIGDGVNAAEKAYDGGATTYADASASRFDSAQCHDSDTDWAAWVPLKGSATGAIKAFCVDSTGASREVETVLGGDEMVCPAA